MAQATAKAEAQALVGRTLAETYSLVRVLGIGGMGAVFEAVHATTGKRVAIKVLSASSSHDLKLITRFRREAIAASRLTHENCVHIDDFGEDKDGTFYIAMELIPGHGLLDELRATGPMAPDRVARIGVQLLGALDAAHAAGVLHRDLKPQNVMLMQKANRPDIVKVVDFGIAKLTTHEPRDQAMLTVPGAVFGTPEYMSPEQARGEVLDTRSDLYSAAVLLWHLLLGRSPFRGTSIRDTLLKVFSEEPPSPLRERPELQLPDGFEHVLRRALAKNREERWPDAASFAAALAPFTGDPSLKTHAPRPIAGLPTDGGPPPETLPAPERPSSTLVGPTGTLVATPAIAVSSLAPASPTPSSPVPSSPAPAASLWAREAPDVSSSLSWTIARPPPSTSTAWLAFAHSTSPTAGQEPSPAAVQAPSGSSDRGPATSRGADPPRGVARRTAAPGPPARALWDVVAVPTSTTNRRRMSVAALVLLLCCATVVVVAVVAVVSAWPTPTPTQPSSSSSSSSSSWASGSSQPGAAAAAR